MPSTRLMKTSQYLYFEGTFDHYNERNMLSIPTAVNKALARKKQKTRELKLLEDCVNILRISSLLFYIMSTRRRRNFGVKH